MTKIIRIERMAAKKGYIINIAPANSWIGSKGKGKWAYSLYIKGQGIYEPIKAYGSLIKLEESLKQIFLSLSY